MEKWSYQMFISPIQFGDTSYFIAGRDTNKHFTTRASIFRRISSWVQSRDVCQIKWSRTKNAGDLNFTTSQHFFKTRAEVFNTVVIISNILYTKSGI